MSDLQLGLDKLNNGETVDWKMFGLMKVTGCLFPRPSSVSPSIVEAARKEFFDDLVSKDLQTLDTLCELIVEEHHKDPKDPDKRCLWMLSTINFIMYNFTNCTIAGRMVEKGFIFKLLEIMPELKKSQLDYTFQILCRLIELNFKPSKYLERSIYVKGAIFSKLPMIYSVVKKYHPDEELLSKFFHIFSQYLMNADIHYFKSDVKLHLNDGTINNVVNLLSDMSNRDGGFVDKFINLVLLSFYQIGNCVRGTVYESKFQRNELKLLNRLAIKHFSAISKETFYNSLRAFLISLREEIEFANAKDIKYYHDNKLYKKLISKFVFDFKAEGDIDYPDLCDMIQCLNTLETCPLFENLIELRDVRSLIHVLPKLVNSKLHVDAPASTNFFLYRILLASSVLRRSFLQEEHYEKLKKDNILSLIVENIRKFHGKDLIISQLSFTMLHLCISPEHLNRSWLSLSEIDQVIPGIPLILKVLGNVTVDELPLNMRTGFPVLMNLDVVMVKICSLIAIQLIRIKENGQNSCINSQLHALKECNFISDLGRALIRAKQVPVIDELMFALYKSCKLFGSRSFMESLCAMMPEIAKKQVSCFFEARDENSFAFSIRCTWIMRKAAAYVLDDLHPDFVRHICTLVLSGWLTFRQSEGRMFFSSDLQSNKEEFEEIPLVDESIVDVLRATWWMIKKYPNLVNSKLPRFNSVFKAVSSDGDITLLTSTIILETIKSYLDNSQEKSTDFLIELTGFVKDLTNDFSCSDEKMEQIFIALVPACERFMILNKNEEIAVNLQYFIDMSNGIICDGLLLD